MGREGKSLLHFFHEKYEMVYLHSFNIKEVNKRKTFKKKGKMSKNSSVSLLWKKLKKK